MATYKNNVRLNTEPYQKLPLRSKTEQWGKDNVDSNIGKAQFGAHNGASRKAEMKIAYDLYNSVFDEADFKYITDPYKVSEGFPATLQNINIVKPKIDLLEGEETKRPFPFKVVQTNDEATSRLQDKYKELLFNTAVEIASAGAPDDPVTDKEVDKLEAIGKYMAKDYSDIGEQQAYHSLNYLREKEDIKTKFLINFHDLMCGNIEVGFVGQITGEPIYERINPLFFSCDVSPESGHIEDGDWAARKMKMTAAAIYDRFYDLITESELDDLLGKFKFDGMASSKNTMESTSGITWKSGMDFNRYEFAEDDTLDVWHVVWRSLKKVGFITYMDEEGEEITEVVDETYEVSEGEDLEWDWVTEIWEGYRIGEDMYVGVQPIANQQISLDNPNSAKLPYIGTLFTNKNTESKSLVEIMKPLQYLYIAIVYQMQLSIARDKGKILTVDVTQIPKSLGIDANKWLHYLSSTNVNFINPYETGWDTPGREGGKPAQHTQFSQADLSMSRVIMDYIQLMTKIEDMIGELSGVSRQRQGQIQSNELVGNVQQTIVQSSHITEYLFYTHNNFKKRVYTQLLNTAKAAWANSGKKKLHYFTDDMIRIFMDITDDFLYSDMDIFISDSTKEQQNVEAIKSLAPYAMQNGASLLDVASIYTSENLTDIKHKLEGIEKAKQTREEDMMKLQQEQQAQESQMKAELEKGKQALEQSKLLIQAEDSVRKADTSIQVALIQAESKEVIEQSKIELGFNKLNTDSTVKNEELSLKDRELAETTRSNKSEEAIKRTAAQKTTNTI